MTIIRLLVRPQCTSTINQRHSKERQDFKRIHELHVHTKTHAHTHEHTVPHKGVLQF